MTELTLDSGAWATGVLRNRLVTTTDADILRRIFSRPAPPGDTINNILDCGVEKEFWHLIVAKIVPALMANDRDECLDTFCDAAVAAEEGGIPVFEALVRAMDRYNERQAAEEQRAKAAAAQFRF